jgi:hypothetical protein
MSPRSFWPRALWGWAARAALLGAVLPASASPATRLPHIGSFDVSVLGLSATVDPLEPTIPKNIASAVHVVVKAGNKTLTADDLASYVGSGFQVRAELSGPGLGAPVTLPDLGPSDPPPTDPLLLPIPALPIAGNYSLSNIRLIREGQTVLDVSPATIPIKIIDQILVTSVQTRPLTLAEIRDKGIVLDSDDYLGFEFTIGLATNSQSVSFSMPVVFDRAGVPVPQVIQPPPDPPRVGVSTPGFEPPAPLIIPSLLDFDPVEVAGVPEVSLRLPGGAPIRIPSVLVIPGNVGYLKQFFSAQLFVANGAPVASGLSVANVTGTVELPEGADHELGTADDPLSLPDTVRGPQPQTLAVRGVGLDGQPGTADDVDELQPAQQGQAEFLVRGDQEGFYPLSFAIDATLKGLPVGDVGIKGKASGGVLVRNPFFDMTFTTPSVVRKGETFSVFATVTNIGKGLANDVSVTLDASRMSGAELVSEPSAHIDTLRGGDAKTLEYKFLSLRTGQVQATYLHFDTNDGSGGKLKFTLGVGERGVALSPDTLVLPAAVDGLPGDVVDAAMRVLGQAWSIANAPTGTLPSDVIRVTRGVATEKALALAEAGLRVELGQDTASAVRDLAFDFYGGDTLDAGFDQLLRQTAAGSDFARTLGTALGGAFSAAGGTLGYGAAIDRVATSGGDYVRVSIGSGTGAAPVTASVTDAGSRKSVAPTRLDEIPISEIPGGAWVPFGPEASEPLVGLFAIATSPIYTLDLQGTGSGSMDLSVTLPRGGGTFSRGTLGSIEVTPTSHLRLVMDLRRPDTLSLDIDREGDGTFESSELLATEVVQSTGPELVSATVVGPETIDGASPFGMHVALLFDRVVDPDSSASPASYSIPNNAVLSAKSQLSGRFVFASLAQPEGPYVPTTLASNGVRDQRGARGPPKTVPLGSRLVDPGAVVTGHVVGPDGQPVTTGTVTYLNNSNWQCSDDVFGADASTKHSGFAAAELDASGRYEFRYVRQDQCGLPWGMVTEDPRTGALRSVTGYVQQPGERMVLDIALLGQGSVNGTVRDLANQVVPGALVTVVSQTDPQVGGTAVTDGDGHYEIAAITVGAVNVSAAKGAGVGNATGNIARAGGFALVDVTLDSGAAALGGRVVAEAGTTTTAAAGALVTFAAAGTVVAVTQTALDGSYFFDSVPVGPYTVHAALNARDQAQATGVLAAGETRTNVDLLITLPDPSGGGTGGNGGLGFGTVRGVVLLSDGTPAPGVIVSISGRGVLSAADGSYELTGVPVRPGQGQSVGAESRDGLRSGSAIAFVNQANQVVEGVVVVLSGLGSAEFLVLGPSGTPIAGQTVGLMDRCDSSCGCNPQTSDVNGKLRFDGLPLGGVHVHAVRPGTSFVDVADASASVTHDGEVAAGTLQFRGSGVVSGTVTDGNGKPVFGADVVLGSLYYSSETCGFGSGVSQRIKTDSLGHYRFQAVNVGGVSVTASQTFLPNPVSKAGVLTANGQELVLDLTLATSASTIAGELSGTVFLPDGVTPAGSGIELTASGQIPDVVVSTDAKGHYRFAKIFPEGSYVLTARDPITGGVAQSSVFLRASQDLAQDVRLLGRGTVRVRVVDANDLAVKKAFVRLHGTSFPNQDFEGAIDAATQGIATFDGVFDGPVSAEVTDPTGRGGRGSGVLVAPGAVLDVKVTLSITGRVAGVFVQPDGATPIPFGAITLYSGGRLLGQTTTQGSGSEVGRFSFDNVPAGAFQVSAQDPATARTGSATGTIASQDQTADVTIRAQGLGIVEGFVTSNGLPQGGADVLLTAGPLRANTMSDPSGHYHVTGVPEGPVSVTASLDKNDLTGAAALSGSTSGNLNGDGTTLTLDVALHDSGGVRGQVLRADGVTPASQSLVSLQVAGSTGSVSTLTDATGHFSFDRLPSGPASLSVDVLGSIDQGSSSVTIPAGDNAKPTIVLHGVGSIHGIARDSAGAPTAGTVSISGTGALPWSRTLAAGADGTFALPEVLAGPIVASLTVQTATFTLYGTATGTVTHDADTFVTVQVQPTGIVRGRALRANGTTVALGTEVTLHLLPDRGVLVFNAGNDGRFEINGVPLGNFELRLLDSVSGGVGLVQAQNVAQNGQVVDVGDVVLDDTPVEAVAFDPAAGSLNVAVDRPITVVFSDRLASAQGLTVSDGSSILPASAVLSPDGYGIALHGTWTDSQDITVTATTTITDVFGRHPTAPRSATFHTVDLSPPRVATVTPADGAIEVSGTTSVDVSFSETLGGATDLTTLVIVSGSGGSVPGVTSALSQASVRFRPNASLAENQAFTVSVNGAVDVVGNKQTTAFISHFKTRDTEPPLLALTQPPPGSWVASAHPPIVVSLSDALSGIDPAQGTLALDGVAVVPARDGSSLRFTPALTLGEGVHSLDATAVDRAGNGASLTSSVQVDTLPPGPAVVAGVASGDPIVGSIALSASASDSGSGVERILVTSDGTTVLTFLAPDFAGNLSSLVLSEGAHSLAAHAVDRAGNGGPSGPAIGVYVNNQPVLVTISTPAVGSRVRQAVSVEASASEPIQRMVFTAGGQTVTDDVPPYAAMLDLAAQPEGSLIVTATAVGFVGDTGSATREVTVDRTPPPAPDASRIFAEPPDNGLSLVHGDAGAVEGLAKVIATNARTSATAFAAAASDGSFALSLAGVVGDTVSLVAQDPATNTSPPAMVTIRSTTTLPPATATLKLEGVLVDRVGAGTPALSPDGHRDPVFSVAFDLGASITRPLAFVDLAGPTTLSTRPEVGAALGVVHAELGAPLLNGPDGQVSASLTGSSSLLLFAPSSSFLQAGASYRATVAFTNGSRFIGTFTLLALPTEEASSPAFSVSNQVLPFDPSGPGGSLLATEATSSAFSVMNQALPVDPHGPPGALLATETASATFSLQNQALPFNPAGPPATFLASETVSAAFSVSNQALPFDPAGPGGSLLARETAGATFSVRNGALPFDPAGPGGSLLATEASPVMFSMFNSALPFIGLDRLASETAGPIFSLNDDPTAVLPPATAASNAMSLKLVVNAAVAGIASAPAGVGGALPVLAVADASARESDGELTFVATLSAASAGPASVDFKLVRDTATPGSEYEPVQGTLTFAPGAPSQTVKVRLEDDTLHERAEHFVLSLSSPSGLTLATDQALATIVDDDPPEPGRALLFDDFSDDGLDTWRWLEPVGTARVSEDSLWLEQAGIESERTFEPGSTGASARARLRLREATQRFGWNALGSVPGPSYFFEATARPGEVRAVARDVDANGDAVTLLEEDALGGVRPFADYAIERRAGEVVFSIDGAEVARVETHSTAPLPVAVASTGEKDALAIDWVEVLPLGARSGACLEPERELAAWWPADGDGRELVGGLDAVLEGDVGFAPGRAGEAFVFGTTGRVWIPESQALVPSELTLGAWVELTSPPAADGVSTLIAKPALRGEEAGPASSEPAYALRIDAQGRPLFEVWAGDHVVRLLAPGVIADGHWHHVAATRSGTLMLLYVDGAEVAAGSADGATHLDTTPGLDVELGNYLSLGAGRAVDGLMDEVAIYDGALDAAEIRKIYDSGSAGYCLP